MVSVNRFIELLKYNDLWVESQSIKPDMLISGKPVTDSRQIQAGDAFVCIKGLQSDGHKYIKQAHADGAQLIVQENEFIDEFPAIRVNNSRKAAAIMAKQYFNNPSGQFILIGVTGTNGKTTTSMLIWQALSELGFKTGWIGTLGYRIESDIIKTNNTTPDIIELNTILKHMAEAGCRYVVMEVSSHALALDRVYGLEFDLSIFTNLTRDHLDFHQDMNSYFECKYQLFVSTLANGGNCIINIDDEYGRIISSRNAANYSESIVTISEKAGDVIILSQSSSLNGTEIKVKLRETVLNLKTQLIGHFNVVNMIMAIATLKVQLPDIENSALQTISSSLKPVRGRLEQIDNEQDRGIFVDYAHTPDALSNVLTTLKQIPHRKILVLFGAGGDRDRGKRSEMLKAVLKYSDATIITDDNPRFEAPNNIIRDIVGDNDIWKPWWIIRDRQKAIQSILRLSQPGDIVLIAGKGHETYQEIKGVKYPFDDAEIARAFDNYDTELPDDELYLPVNQLLLELLYDKPPSSDEDSADSYIGGYKHISTDSRTIKPRSIYFALKGEVFDGHDYIDSVLADPTCCSVASYGNTSQNRLIIYGDSESALGLLAKKYLLMFSAFRIALTGSTGKTTTKEYMANIFTTTGKVLKTYANENNTIGLSKTIFRIKPDDKTAIFELGTNHHGEIAKLANICNPDMGVIINIGPSHLEFLKDENGVYEEKTALFRRDISKILYPGDDERFFEFATIGSRVGYSKNCDYRIDELHVNYPETKFNMKSFCWRVPQIVPFYLNNIAFAVACALECGISAKDIQMGLDKPLDLKMRMEIKQVGSKIVIFDCYNANPVSMKSAIEFWDKSYPDRPHIAVLGDMLELGERSLEFHKNIGLLLGKLNYNRLYTIGDMSHYFSIKENGYNNEAIIHEHFTNIEEFLESQVLQILPENSILLVKASHGMHLEKINNVLISQTSKDDISFVKM